MTQAEWPGPNDPGPMKCQEVDGSANGATWTTLVPATAYTFTAGSNAVAIPVPAGTRGYLRLDISGNTSQGVPQIAEFVVYDN